MIGDDVGRVGSAETGSRASTEPGCAVSALAGFDPARLRELAEAEDMILAALTYALETNCYPYAYYSPAYDATITRSTALRQAAIAIEARRAATENTGAVEDESAGRKASPKTQPPSGEQ